MKLPLGGDAIPAVIKVVETGVRDNRDRSSCVGNWSSGPLYHPANDELTVTIWYRIISQAGKRRVDVIFLAN